MTSGTLPAGLILNATTGSITGIPAAAVATNFVIKVSDAQDPPAETTAALSITIEPTKPRLLASVTPASILVGQSASFVAALGQSQGAPAPSGPIQFQIDGENTGSPVPVIGGSATLPNQTFTAKGTYAITALYSGDANYSSVISMPVSLTVSALTPSITVSVDPAVIAVAQRTTFTAQVFATEGSSVPNGTVQFQVNGTNLGSPIGLSSGMATLPHQEFSSSGKYTITAVYSGDSNYNPATSAKTTLTVNPATATLEVDPGTLSLAAPGATGQATLRITRFQTDSIRFSCTGLPVNTKYEIGPLSGNGSSGSAVLSIRSTAPYHSNPVLQGNRIGGGSTYAMVFPGLMTLAGLWRRRRHRRRLQGWISLFILSGALTFTGCGVQFNGTPPGTYTIAVIASGGTQSASTTFTLIVDK